jgi:hypothetical protein
MFPLYQMSKRRHSADAKQKPLVTSHERPFVAAVGFDVFDILKVGQLLRK